MNLSQRVFVSTKGKIFNTPWDHARPGRGQRGALTYWLPAPWKRAPTLLQSCPGRDQPPPHLGSPGVPRPAHAQGRVPFWCCAGSPSDCPRVLQLVGTVRSPCPWVACQLPLGRGAAGETPAQFRSLHALFAVVSGETRVYVCFLEGGGSGQSWLLVALGQFALCLCLLSLFSGGNGAKPPLGLPGVCSVPPAIPQLLPIPQNSWGRGSPLLQTCSVSCTRGR